MAHHVFRWSDLKSSHARRLRWFHERVDQVVPLPGEVQGLGFLVTRAKGIYKPADLAYALSIRSMISSPYADKAVEEHADGSWSFDYFQENPDPGALRTEYTNRAMLRCHDDRVPLGVLVQTSTTPARYRVMGLALVRSWENGFFHLESARAADD